MAEGKRQNMDDLADNLHGGDINNCHLLPKLLTCDIKGTMLVRSLLGHGLPDISGVD